MSNSTEICIGNPITWPDDLKKWGMLVAKTVPYVDPFPEPPAGYFGNSELDRYYLRGAVVAARNRWGS